MTQQDMMKRVDAVQDRIAQAAIESGRKPEDITLVAASKMNDSSCVRMAQQAGIATFGENRVQELVEKYEQGAYQDANLHFIGSLQTNKVKFVVGKASLIHSVNSFRLLQAIAQQANKANIVQDVLIEVNIAKEPSKTGLFPDEMEELLQISQNLSAIRICGLMAIPPRETFEGENSRYFADMKQLYVDISQKKYDNVYMNILSMGMSSDFEQAIRCGANMVRVGTAIFGTRQYIV